MRFVALAFIMLSLPVFIALLNKYRDKRDWALLAIGVMMFLVGTIQVDAAVVSWHLWQGTLRGIFLSPIDTLAIALIVTRQGTRYRTPLLGLVMLYLIPATLSIFVSAMPMASFFASMMILKMIVMFVALAGELHRVSALRQLMTGMALGLIIQGAYVIQQKLSGVVQAPGTTDHQNIVGMMVEMSLIPLIAITLEGERRKIIYAGIFAGLIVVAGGGSRATMGFTAFGIVLLLILSIVRRTTPRKLKVLGFAFLTALVVVPMAMATLSDRFGSRTMITAEEVRDAMEVAAREMAADNILGVGANTFPLVANQQGYYQKAGVPWGGSTLAQPVHNGFLLMRAETGWLGEGIMIALLVIPAIAGLRLAFADRRSAMMGMTAASAIVAFVTIAHSKYEYAWHLEVVQRLYFTNLAIIAASLMWHKARRKKSGMRANSAPRLAPSAAHE